MNVIGKPRRRVDGRAKVTGSTRFADDLALPRMLHCKLLRSPHPHAAIVSIDASRAKARPGVHLVLTGKDVPVEYGILRLYKTEPNLEILFELMTDFDEGFQEWRYRHIKLVERTIGSKKGTGGSLGVEFLKRSLFHPVFPDLWAIRHRL